MGLLRPGDRLPPEARLADALGISPVSLRSALAMLRSAGLLETRRGRGGGTFVTATEPPRPGDAELPSERELRDLVDYRAIVEGGAAELAARRAEPAQLEHLAELTAGMAAIADFRRWSEQDTLLHLVIADAAGPARLMVEVGRVRAEVFRISQLVPVPPQAGELATREHADLVEAITRGRPDRARAAMVRHVESTGALWLGLGRVPRSS